MCLIVARALPVGARAATIENVSLEPGSVPALRLTGVIQSGDDAAFHALVDQMSARAPKPIVILASPGGRVNPALRIGLEIRARGFTTLVPEEAKCASACALIWLAGTTRMLADGARIGLHAMSVPDQNGRYTETHEQDMVLHQYLTYLGYALDTTATIVNTPASLVRWLDPVELDAQGIATTTYPR